MRQKIDVDKYLKEQQKTAREMFEELGYKEIINTDAVIVYRNHIDTTIAFHLLINIITIKDFAGNNIHTSFNELKAINKQIEELEV